MLKGSDLGKLEAHAKTCGSKEYVYKGGAYVCKKCDEAVVPAEGEAAA